MPENLENSAVDMLQESGCWNQAPDVEGWRTQVY